MFLLKGKKVNPDAPITVGGVTFPNLRDPAVRDSLGVVETPDPIYPDTKAFTWTENPDGTINVVAKPADLVKEETKADLQGQIDAIEQKSLLPRVVREYLLSLPSAAQKPWYAKLKELDDQITTLRGKFVP